MPLNRFIAFVKPYINLLAGAISAWLIAKANVLSIPGLGEHGDELTAGIAAAITFAVTTLATQVGDLKWLKGHHVALAGDAQVQAAALTASAAPPPAGPMSDMDTADDLPSDDEEFASPPPGDPPVQPSQSGLIDP
jgi:hypothetical protein